MHFREYIYIYIYIYIYYIYITIIHTHTCIVTSSNFECSKNQMLTQAMVFVHDSFNRVAWLRPTSTYGYTCRVGLCICIMVYMKPSFAIDTRIFTKHPLGTALRQGVSMPEDVCSLACILYRCMILLMLTLAYPTF